MADHHDIVDSALDLLRSRHWAGPNTNPILENALMQARTPRSRINLRLVLGLGAALIGCGAVAAATRPAWITTLLAQETKAATPPAPVLPAAKPVTVAASQPAKAERPAAPVKVPALIASAPVAPSPQPAVAAAPAITVEEPIETITVSGMQLDETLDPASSMIDAFWNSLLCGDFEACEHLAHMIENPPQLQWRSRSYVAAVNTPGQGLMLSGIPLIGNVLRERTAEPIFLTVEGTAVTGGDVTFTVDLQGQWTGGEPLDLQEIKVLGGPIDGSGVLQLFVAPAQPAQPLKP